MVQHAVILCIIATWKNSCTYSHERRVTRVWETAVHDDSVLLTRSLHTQSTPRVNLLLKVKRQSNDETARPATYKLPWKKWPKKIHKGITSLSSIPIPPIPELLEPLFAFSGDYEWAFLQERVSHVGGRQWVEEEPQIQQNCEKRSAHALSKDVWHLAPDGNRSINVMKSIAEGEVSSVSAPLAASNELEQLWRNLSGVFACKTEKQCVVCGCKVKRIPSLQNSLQTWLQYNASLWHYSVYTRNNNQKMFSETQNTQTRLSDFIDC